MSGRGDAVFRGSCAFSRELAQRPQLAVDVKEAMGAHGAWAGLGGRVCRFRRSKPW